MEAVDDVSVTAPRGAERKCRAEVTAYKRRNVACTL